ncbi:MAG: pilus assembly PilX N-terminal domain-containing protein, partial [Desulfobacterota bacterium]|nr:pilus assembly PilX N-terminal domain-containing protein [Thermodesulfobacteriota bacterium]
MINYRRYRKTVSMKQYNKATQGENGFVLALAIFMLAICTMIGIAAMMTSTTETDIATNEVIYRQTFYQAEAGAIAAVQAILTDQGLGQGQAEWDDNTPMNADNSVTIVDGLFLWEGKDSDNASNFWNNWKRYTEAPSGMRDNYKPLDDLMVSGENPILPFETDTRPDIILRSQNPPFNIDIDVDKIASRHIAGSGAEFGTGAE